MRSGDQRQRAVLKRVSVMETKEEKMSFEKWCMMMGRTERPQVEVPLKKLL